MCVMHTTINGCHIVWAASSRASDEYQCTARYVRGARRPSSGPMLRQGYIKHNMCGGLRTAHMLPKHAMYQILAMPLR